MQDAYRPEDARHQHSVVGKAVLARLREMGKTQLDLVAHLEENGFDVTPQFVGNILFGINANKHEDKLGLICEYVGLKYISNRGSAAQE